MSNRKSSLVEKMTVVVMKEVDADADAEVKEQLDSDFDISDSEVKHEVFTIESESEDNDGNEADVWWLEEPRGKKKEVDPKKIKSKYERKNKNRNEKRKQIREENPERYEAYKRKHQEAKKRSNQRMREEHPEAYEAMKRRTQEAKTRKLQKMKEETPAEYEAYKRKNQEAKKRRRQALKEEDPEKYEALIKRDREALKRRKIAKEAEKLEMEMMLKVGDPGESKEDQGKRMRMEKMMEENPEVWAEVKQKIAKMTPEERREKYHEMNKKWNEEQEERRKKSRFYHLLRRVQMTEEEKEAAKEKQRNYLKNLSGEKLERYKQSVAKALRKRYEKIKNEALNQGSQLTETARERWNNYCRKKVANETPEQRQKRLRKYKINAARRKLRKELEEIGVPPEEIERRSKLMKEEMEKEPLPPLKSEYRPRLQGRKPHQVSNPSSATRSSSRSSSNITPNPAESSIQEDFDDHMFQNDNSSLPPSSPCNMSDGDDTSQSFAGINVDADFVESYEAMLSEPAPVNHVCEECKGSFISEDDVRTHFKLIHIQKCWKCPKCSELCISPVEFAEHYKSHSHDSSNQESVKHCESVERNSASTNDKTHGSKHSNVTFRFSCLKCQEKCKSLNALSEHVRKFHPESFWQCPTCKLVKYHQSSLLNHQKFCKIILKSYSKKRK